MIVRRIVLLQDNSQRGEERCRFLESACAIIIISVADFLWAYRGGGSDNAAPRGELGGQRDRSQRAW